MARRLDGDEVILVSALRVANQLNTDGILGHFILLPSLAGPRAVNFLDGLQFLTYDRSTQIAIQILFVLCFIIKCAAMVCIRPMHRTVKLLTLARNTCKCKLFLTALLLTTAGRVHFSSVSYTEF
jgi:hypothetical protein